MFTPSFAFFFSSSFSFLSSYSSSSSGVHALSRKDQEVREKYKIKLIKTSHHFRTKSSASFFLHQSKVKTDKQHTNRESFIGFNFVWLLLSSINAKCIGFSWICLWTMQNFTFLSLSISLEDSYSIAVTIPAHPPPPISPAVPKSPYSPLSTFSTFHPPGQDRTSPEGSSCGELEDSDKPGDNDCRMECKEEKECLYAKEC